MNKLSFFLLSNLILNTHSDAALLHLSGRVPDRALIVTSAKVDLRAHSDLKVFAKKPDSERWITLTHPQTVSTSSAIKVVAP